MDGFFLLYEKWLNNKRKLLNLMNEVERGYKAFLNRNKILLL